MFNSPQDDLPTLVHGKCPVCGGENFEWGRMGSQDYYIPGQSLWSRRGIKYVRARRCLQCNNLMLFTDDKLSTQMRNMIAVIVVIALIAVGIAILLPVLLGAYTPR